MITVTSKTTTVFAAQGGHCKTRLTAMTAYRDATWLAWKGKHFPCGCDSEVGFVCGYHRNNDFALVLASQRRLVLARLARWLMWRDGLRIPKRLTKLCDRFRKEKEYHERAWRAQ